MTNIIASGCMLFILSVGLFTLPLKPSQPQHTACYMPLDR